MHPAGTVAQHPAVFQESREDQERPGSSDDHGVGGPLRVPAPSTSVRWKLAEHFVEAAVEAGLPPNDDFNSGNQDGAGHFQCTMKQARRWSTAAAYLGQAKNRPNLTIETEALATKVLVEEAGRAVGVAYLAPARGDERGGGHAASNNRLRRCLQLAAALAAIGDRAGRAAAQARHPGGTRPARRRQRTAGSFLRPRSPIGCTQPITLNDVGNSSVRRTGGGHPILPVPLRAARQQRHLRRRFRQERRAAIAPGHPAQFQHLEFPGAGQSRRPPAPVPGVQRQRRASAARRARPCPDQEPRPDRAAVDPVQFPEDAIRPRRAALGHAPGAQDHPATGDRAAGRRGDPSSAWRRR